MADVADSRYVTECPQRIEVRKTIERERRDPIVGMNRGPKPRTEQGAHCG